MILCQEKLERIRCLQAQVVSEGSDTVPGEIDAPSAVLMSSWFASQL